MGSGTRPTHLNEIRTLAVTEAVRSFGVYRDRSSSDTKRGDCVVQSFRSCDDRWHAFYGRGEQLRFLIKIRCAKWYFGQCLREFRLGGLRREGIITTPAGSGGR